MKITLIHAGVSAPLNHRRSFSIENQICDNPFLNIYALSVLKITLIHAGVSTPFNDRRSISIEKQINANSFKTAISFRITTFPIDQLIMRFQIPVFFSFWITLVSWSGNIMGQSDTLPYDKWIEYLSVKSDLHSENFLRVYKDFQSIPKEQICEVLSILKSKDSPGNPRRTIRIMTIEGINRLTEINILECPGTEPDLQVLQEALNMAYELEDEILIFQIYGGLVSYYIHESNSNQATLYGLLAKELYEKHGPDTIFPISHILFNLASSFYHAREYRAAIDVLSKFLRLKDDQYLSPSDTFINKFGMFGWNTLGLAYTKLHIPDSAFIAFNKGMDFAEELNNDFWKGLIAGNRGDVYYQLGRYDSAQVLIEKDYRSSIAAGELDNAANSLQWLARIDLVHNKTHDALKKARDAKSSLYNSYQPYYMANTLLTFTKVFIQ
ncbi:MAG: tetratricopeptide repeat protein, partial [Bacteroidota bacterium]|nr:tetratricopeptide repeat protein [Bacteroidota bacterium]